MAQPEHSKILTAAARKYLAPLGVRQRGRSRTWIDDHGWWLVLIEFQPSDWDRGSHLNVGAMWLWYEKDYFSFDDGYRVADFVPARSAEQFSPHAEQLAIKAKEQVLMYRARFSSVRDVARWLGANGRDDFWDLYHAAIASGLSGDVRNARRMFQKLVALNGSRDWEQAALTIAREYESMLHDIPALRNRINEVVRRARSRLKLEEMGDSDFIQAK